MYLTWTFVFDLNFCISKGDCWPAAGHIWLPLSPGKLPPQALTLRNWNITHSEEDHIAAFLLKLFFFTRFSSSGSFPKVASFFEIKVALIPKKEVMIKKILSILQNHFSFPFSIHSGAYSRNIALDWTNMVFIGKREICCDSTKSLFRKQIES